MDKKTGIIIGVICAVVAVLLCVAFVMDSKIEDIPNDVLLIIGKTRYTVDDYNLYRTLKNYEAGDPNKEMTEEDKTNMINAFTKEKVYYAAAMKKGVTLENEADYHQEYEGKSGDFIELGITEEDYQKIKKEQAVVSELENNYDKYYSLPDDVYTQIVDEFKEEDLYDTYQFRVMQIPYEEKKEESGDTAVSGDVVEPVEEAPESGEEKKDMSKEAQQQVAEDVLLRIRSGEDFEELAKEFGTTRIAYVKDGLRFINGEVEYATGPVLKSKLANIDSLYNAVTALNSGDCTDVVEDTDSKSFYIVKVDSKEEGFTGEAEEELKSLILQQYLESFIAQDIKYEYHPTGYMRVAY